MKVFGLVGWSGSGKTTLMALLIPEIISRGYTVSTMKHTHHKFDIDKPGKDSHQHRIAGAQEVMVASSARWALMHELRADAEWNMDELIEKMTPVDVLLIEGFKTHKHPKMEVFRPSLGKEQLWKDDKSVIVVATDQEVSDLTVPRIDLNNVAAVADFVLEYLGLDKQGGKGAA